MTWYEWYFYWAAGWLSFYLALTILIFIGMVVRTWYCRWAHPPIKVEPEPEPQMQPLQITFPEKYGPPLPQPQITMPQQHQGPIWIGGQTFPGSSGQPWAGSPFQHTSGNISQALGGLLGNLGGTTLTTNYADLHDGPNASSATCP